MEGTPRDSRIYYRGAARTMVPGSPALHGHPKNVYLPEAAILGPLNDWLGKLFAAETVDRTVAALLASQAKPNHMSTQETLTKRLANAETRLRKFQTAIGAGVDPAALVEAINDAQSEHAAAKAALDKAPAPNTLTDADIYAMVDCLGDIGRALKRADPADLQKAYEQARLELVYDAETRAVDATIQVSCAGIVRVSEVVCTDCHDRIHGTRPANTFTT